MSALRDAFRGAHRIVTNDVGLDSAAIARSWTRYNWSAAESALGASFCKADTRLIKQPMPTGMHSSHAFC